MQGKPHEADLLVGRAGGMCGLYHSAGKPAVSETAPGYVVGDCSWLEREIQILISSPRKSRSSCQGIVLDRAGLLQKIQEVVMELEKTNQSKTQPSAGLCMRNIQKLKGEEWERLGR